MGSGMDEARAARPMTDVEVKVRDILKRRFWMVDTFAYEGTPVAFESVACEIVRELATDMAFAVLTKP
jgi:hypothetical protein